MRAILCTREIHHMLTDRTRPIAARRSCASCVRGLVRKQQDLVRLLKKEGHDVTQSSVSRDLRDLGVLKASGGYVLPAEEDTRARMAISARSPRSCAA